jgi:hypothetical protein
LWLGGTHISLSSDWTIYFASRRTACSFLKKKENRGISLSLFVAELLLMRCVLLNLKDRYHYGEQLKVAMESDILYNKNSMAAREPGMLESPKPWRLANSLPGIPRGT